MYGKLTCRWVGITNAAALIDSSTEYIEDRATPWPDDDAVVPGSVRYLVRGVKRERRYFVPDVEALLERDSGGWFRPVLLEDGPGWN